MFSDQFSKELSDLASEWSASRSGARETASRFDSGPTLAAQGTFLGLVFRDGKVQQRLGLDTQFQRAAASINQSSGSNNSPAGFLNHLNRLLRRAARRPNIFNHKNMLVRLKRKSASQGHRTAGIALGKQRRHSPARNALRLWQSPRNFLPDNHATQSRRNNSPDYRIGKQRGQRLPKFLGQARVLQNERALYVSPAMQPAGKLKVPVPDRSGRLENP